MTLEIERKFLYNFDIEKKLNDLNAKQIKNVNMIDDYYDNADSHFLVLNDCWLRLRKSCSFNNNNNKKEEWQLKYPSKFTNDLLD